LEVDVGQATNVLDVLNAFDIEIYFFQNNMRTKVVNAIKYFVNFLQAYDQFTTSAQYAYPHV
jgi:hypothetical protein